MQTHEVHLSPQRFEPLHDSKQTAIHTDASIRVVTGTHIIVQEYRENPYQFTGRWIRYLVTHVETTSDHRLIISLHEITRSVRKLISKRAA